MLKYSLIIVKGIVQCMLVCYLPHSFAFNQFLREVIQKAGEEQ